MRRGGEVNDEWTDGNLTIRIPVSRKFGPEFGINREQREFAGKRGNAGNAGLKPLLTSSITPTVAGPRSLPVWESRRETLPGR